MDPEDSKVCLRYILTHARQQDFLETAGGVPRRGGRAARKVATRFARRKLRRNHGKGSSVPRKKHEDAAAAAEFFVSKRGRKPVEFCGR